MNAPEPELKCSRAGCRAAATNRIVWRNPRIHGPDREKVWLACAEHLRFLYDYLRARDFPARIDAAVGEGERE
jgi:hypothetical protein